MVALETEMPGPFLEVSLIAVFPLGSLKRSEMAGPFRRMTKIFAPNDNKDINVIRTAAIAGLLGHMVF